MVLIPPEMFLFLNRVMKVVVLGMWAAAAAWVWSERERGRPLLDWYQVWHDCGYAEPAPLPRLDGSVVRVLAPSTLLFREEGGATYSLGLVGWILPDANRADPKALRVWSAMMTSNLTQRLVGQTGHFAYATLQTNWVGLQRAPNRTGTGFLYLGTNTLNLAFDLVTEGKIRVSPAALQILSLREQVAFRAAARRTPEFRTGAETGMAPQAARSESEAPAESLLRRL